MISVAIMAILSATRGKADDRRAELQAILRVVERLLHGGLRHADRPRRGLDARRFEGLHQLLEAEAFDAAEQVFGRHLEAVEGDLVFLHAAIAEHLDFGAGHAFRRERFAVVAARLFRQQHRQAAMADSFGLVRTNSVIRSARTGWVIQVLLP